MNAAELRDQTHTRDARSVGNFEVHFSDPDPWIDALKADYALDAIADNIVWLAVTTGPITMAQLIPERGFDHRVNTVYAARYVEANYIARGQMQKLSAYCGPVWQRKGPPPRLARAWGEETAQRLQETARRLQVVLSGLKGLTVRSGGSLHLHNLEEPWTAHPEQSIEALPEVACATCGRAIYYANEAWRHKVGGGYEDPNGFVAVVEGRTEAHAVSACERCHGTKHETVGGREQRCSECRQHPGERWALHHDAEPEASS